MTAISKAWVTIADGQVDPDSPIDTALMQGLRDDLVHLREWLGASYTAGAVQNHSHDGVDSALVPIGANAVRNGSFESGVIGWTFVTFTGGTLAINTANAMDGANCLSVTSTVLANGGGTATSNEFIPAAAFMPYSVRGIVKASAANVSSRLEAIWYDSAQTQISVSNAYDTTNTPTAQTEVGTELTAPANTRFYKLKLTGGVPAAGSATGTVYFDQIFAQKPVTGLIRFTKVTATDAAFAPLPATHRIVVCCVGGGGGGAGVHTAGTSSSLSCGEKGNISWGYTNTVEATYAVTIGAGGVGGNQGDSGGAATAGSATSFGSVATASGGNSTYGAITNVTVGSNFYHALQSNFSPVTAARTTAGDGNNGQANTGNCGGGAFGGPSGAYVGGNGGSGVVFVWEYA